MNAKVFHVLIATAAVSCAVAEPAAAQQALAAPTTAHTSQVTDATQWRTGQRVSSTGAYSIRNAASRDNDFVNMYIRNRLSLGLTFSYFKLTEGDRPADRSHDFLGNINQLNDVDNFLVLPTIDYVVCDYVSVGLTYMKISAETMNFNNNLGDGTAVMEGPALTVDFTYPLYDGTLKPHLGLGLAILKGDFHEDSWWHLGYSSPDAWKYYGHSKHTRSGYFRYIDVDDAVEPFFSVGLTYLPHERVKLDASFRMIDLDPSCEFGYDYGRRGKSKHATGDFDMSGYFLLFSASYVF